jgi:hypothetical protein
LRASTAAHRTSWSSPEVSPLSQSGSEVGDLAGQLCCRAEAEQQQESEARGDIAKHGIVAIMNLAGVCLSDRRYRV